MTTEINPGDVVACSDIHARYDLLELFLERVKETNAVVIFLGDQIDRGGQDIQVVERIRKLTEDPESEGLSGCFALKGNHEDLFVKAVTGTGDDWGTWLHNGGNFEQFGELQEHLEWFDELPIYMTIGDTLFVHGGLVPGRDPYELVQLGKESTLLWMREPFLSRGPEFEKWNPELKRVIFGHTPIMPDEPGHGLPYEIPGGGVCIDTMAFHSGVLTAYNVTQEAFYQFTMS
jgi:serine/threonine protein phosphatase 1